MRDAYRHTDAPPDSSCSPSQLLIEALRMIVVQAAGFATATGVHPLHARQYWMFGECAIVALSEYGIEVEYTELMRQAARNAAVVEKL